MKQIQLKAKAAQVSYSSGADLAAAANAAKQADVAIVFVHQFMFEGHDAPSLALPDNQDALVMTVAAANPRTIVVLETGGPVSMPWHSSVGAIVAAWYPGIGGAQAIADILFGDVDPSGKLPVTFAAAEADLPHPQVPGLAAMPQPKRDSEGMVVGDPPKPKPFDVDYTEGSQVGYKWFDANRKEPLFPFGFGLSYTTFAYGELKVDTSHRCVTFRVKNTGHREGTEIAEVYVQLPIRAGENFKRLAGWTRVKLAPGEESSVTVPLDPRTLSLFDTEKHRLELPEGDYTVLAGPSSRDTPLSAKANFR